MIARLKNSFLDYLGISASVLCAIHCAMLPFILSISVLPSWLGLHNHVFDLVILALAIVLIHKTIYKDYKKTGNRLSIFLAAIGLLLIIVSKIIHIPLMIIPSVIGGILVAAAHIIKIGQAKV